MHTQEEEDFKQAFKEEVIRPIIKADIAMIEDVFRLKGNRVSRSEIIEGLRTYAPRYIKKALNEGRCEDVDMLRLRLEAFEEVLSEMSRLAVH
jgi:hypothetical protein